MLACAYRWQGSVRETQKTFKNEKASSTSDTIARKDAPSVKLNPRVSAQAYERRRSLCARLLRRGALDQNRRPARGFDLLARRLGEAMCRDTQAF